MQWQVMWMKEFWNTLLETAIHKFVISACTVFFFFLQEKALSVFRLAYDKAVALGYKLDIIFYQIRIGLFYLDNDLITRSIDKAKT